VNVLLLLIPLGLGLLAIALGFFIWAVRNGQLENLEQEGTRILFDDDLPQAPRGEPGRGAPHDVPHDAAHHHAHHAAHHNANDEANDEANDDVRDRLETS